MECHTFVTLEDDDRTMNDRKKRLRLPVLNVRRVKTYVSRAEGEAMFPNGASFVECRRCGMLMLQPTGQESPDCGCKPGGCP